MIELKEQYVVDREGKRVAVILDIEEYNRLLEWIADQEDIIAVKAASASDETGIPLEQAIAEIERSAKGTIPSCSCQNRVSNCPASLNVTGSVSMRFCVSWLATHGLRAV